MRVPISTSTIRYVHIAYVMYPTYTHNTRREIYTVAKVLEFDRRREGPVGRSRTVGFLGPEAPQRRASPSSGVFPEEGVRRRCSLEVSSLCIYRSRWYAIRKTCISHRGYTEWEKKGTDKRGGKRALTLAVAPRGNNNIMCSVVSRIIVA